MRRFLTPICWVAVIICCFLSTSSALTHTQEFRCVYSLVDVPCHRLKKPIVLGDIRKTTKVFYKPNLAIPIWPNDSIFGARNVMAKGQGDLPDLPNAYFNRTDPDKKQRTILDIDLSKYSFDENFVDSDFFVPEYRSFVEEEKVYRGSEIRMLWEEAARHGVVCKAEGSEEVDGRAFSRCAFARKGKSENVEKIEYCLFYQYDKPLVKQNVECKNVVYIANDKPYLLASRYTYYGGDLGYGGGEGRFACRMSGLTPDKATELLEDFLKSEAGEGASESKAANKYHGGFDIDFEVVNKKDPKEGVWERVFYGAFAGPYDDPDIPDMGKYRQKGFKGGSVLELSLNVSTSVRPSDNIVDYRQPEISLGRNIRNAIQGRLKSRLAQVATKVECESAGLQP